jgi:uncharacterized membrane protein
MGISFAAPQALWLILPAIGLTVLLSRAARHHLSTGRRRVALVLRCIVLSVLVLALAGLQLQLPVDRLTTVFLVDLSDSVGDDGRSEAVAFVREALEQAPSGDQAGIVVFGREALVERLPADASELDRLASTPVRTATDLGAALRLAAALFPDGTQKRIVLLSDGNDTTGRGQSEAALAAARGVQVETHVIGLGGADEVLIERLRTPSTARVGEEIEAEVTIRSSIRQPATVRLFGDGASIGSQQVQLEVGVNRVVFTVRATEAGFHTFRAVVEAGRDTFAQNDRADSDTIVKGDPRVLVAAEDAVLAEQLVAALRAERQDVTLVTPAGMPPDVRGLAGYDSVVLVDVPAQSIQGQRMAALQVFVRDLGRGLVMVGGERSFGAGGYKRTPLEETLPVDMDVRDRDREPDVALVVVLDKSGSMDACHCNTANRDLGNAIAGIPKVDIGKEAILRAVAALTARDEFGVVSFDENAHWVINTAPLGEAGDVEGQIAGIRPLGQTNIFAGLSEAVTALEKTRATRRHIILLTDGWSSSGQYEELLDRMEAAGITLSAVGAGGGGAQDFLSGLAERGGGRYYPAVNPATIPDIFLKETQQVSGQQIVEEPFFPIQTASSPILRGLESGLPRLLGYNGTTPKGAAQTVLVSSRDDPVLAQWQYGLGRSVAWTSDATGRWAQAWVGWPGFNRFFSQLVAWTFPGEETGGIEAEFIQEGEDTRLRVTSAEDDGTPRDFYETEVALIGPDLSDSTARLTQTAPGVYETSLGRLDPGAYALRVTQTRPGETAIGRTLGLVAPTPAEYRLLGTNEALLAALRGATGGRELVEPREAWRHDLQATSLPVQLWPWLLLLALLLWPLDVAIRRLSVSRADVRAARGWAVERLRGRRLAPRPVAVGGMLAAKERAGGSRSRAALLRPAAPAPAEASASSRLVSPTSSPASPAGPAGPARPAVPGPATAASQREAPSQDEAPPQRAPESGEGPEPDTLARLRDAKRRARR